MSAWPKPLSETADTVTLNRADWTVLQDTLEDMADSGRIAQAMAALTAGEIEAVPIEIAKRLMTGETPLRIWREHRGFTQSALSARSGVSIPYISEIECGAKPGSLAAMHKLAHALALTLDDLVPWEAEETTPPRQSDR